jgi:hypothetical protein
MVPRLCPGGTVVCLGGGPSLTRDDVEYVRDKADAVIAINNAYQLAPWASVRYGADLAWWAAHPAARTGPALRYALPTLSASVPGVTLLRNTGIDGLETDPSGLRTGGYGGNSGYQAINLAVHLGAARILLLGYDMQMGPQDAAHWHPPHRGNNPTRSLFERWRPYFSTLVAPLTALGIAVINCTRRTALTCFPCVSLADALARAA